MASVTETGSGTICNRTLSKLTCPRLRVVADVAWKTMFNGRANCAGDSVLVSKTNSRSRRNVPSDMFESAASS